jgi:hypothetical protein
MNNDTDIDGRGIGRRPGCTRFVHVDEAHGYLAVASVRLGRVDQEGILLSRSLRNRPRIARRERATCLLWQFQPKENCPKPEECGESATPLASLKKYTKFKGAMEAARRECPDVTKANGGKRLSNFTGPAPLHRALRCTTSPEASSLSLVSSV